MSWDLAFWKPRSVDGTGAPPEAIHDALLEDVEPDHLEWLSVYIVKSTFQAVFPEVIDDGAELNWEGAGSYFEVGWSIGSRPQQTLGVFVACGWGLLKQPVIIERLRSVSRILGCGIYDPQSGKWSD